MHGHTVHVYNVFELEQPIICYHFLSIIFFTVDHRLKQRSFSEFCKFIFWVTLLYSLCLFKKSEVYNNCKYYDLILSI